MKAISVLLALMAAGCSVPPGPAIVSGSQGIDGFLKSLKSDLLDIERRGHKRTSDRFWNKAHDHIEFTACPRENLPAAFQSVRECDREALALLRGFVKERPKEKYTLRRRRRSSGGGGGGSSSRPPPPPSQQPRFRSQVRQPRIRQARHRLPGFCSRTAGVRDAIIAALPAPQPACGAVTQNHLNQINGDLVITLNPRPSAGGQCASHSSLKTGDFAGLVKLQKLYFGGSKSVAEGCLRTFPANIFSDLNELKEIHLGGQHALSLSSIPAATFRHLPKLIKIAMDYPDLTEPAFANLPARITVVDLTQ